MAHSECMRPGSLWSVGDRWIAVAAVFIGGAAVLTSWLGSSGETTVAAQAAWIDVGVVGMMVAAALTTALIVGGRRAVGRRRVALLSTGGPAHVAGWEDLVAAPAAHELVATDDMRYYHRPTCELTTGKAVRPSSADAHQRAGRRPCGICEP